MAMAMAIYVGENSFTVNWRRLQNKQRRWWTVGSVSTNDTGIKNPVNDYNPSIPLSAKCRQTLRGKHPHHGGASRSDYENYLWLFGGRR